MFYKATQFNAPLENWDVSRVTDMYQSEYIRVCDHVHHPCTHLHHNVMYWLSLSLSLSLSTEYDILLCNHTNVVLSSFFSVHSILNLMHPHPQCLIGLNNSTLQSGTGMWVRWLIWHTVSTFVYVIMCIIHVNIYTIMLCTDSLSLSLYWIWYSAM